MYSVEKADIENEALFLDEILPLERLSHKDLRILVETLCAEIPECLHEIWVVALALLSDDRASGYFSKSKNYIKRGCPYYNPIPDLRDIWKILGEGRTSASLDRSEQARLTNAYKKMAVIYMVLKKFELHVTRRPLVNALCRLEDKISKEETIRLVRTLIKRMENSGFNLKDSAEDFVQRLRGQKQIDWEYELYSKSEIEPMDIRALRRADFDDPIELKKSLNIVIRKLEKIIANFKMDFQIKVGEKKDTLKTVLESVVNVILDCTKWP